MLFSSRLSRSILEKGETAVSNKPRRSVITYPSIIVVLLFLFGVVPRAIFGQDLVAPNSDRKLASHRMTSKEATKTASEEPKASGNAKRDSETTEMRERVRALEERLDEMQKIIAAQQQTIQAMSARLGGGAVASETLGSNVPPDPTTAQPQQTATLDDRFKKLEGQVLRIGPFRFSGDFRLRADGTFRKADNDPPAGFAPLTHQQNVRARYRLRLNFDTDLDPKLSFHGQLATGPLNNPLTNDQEFGETNTRHPFFINEVWIDYHPTKAIQLQGGRLQEAFADNSRFLFDDDIRFNGFNEKYIWSFKQPVASISSIEARAGQYIFSNPNVAVVTAGSPLAQAGAIVGTTGRASNLFHQGLLFNQKYNDKWSGQFGGDIQLYRNPNQIQLASTANGVALIVQNGLGITLSGPIAGTGNATTSGGGALYTARNFQIARLTYRLNWIGFKSGDHDFPVVFNVQGSRNVGVGIAERDAVLASIQVGKITKPGDTSYLYIFTRKGANALISQLTDDDIGTNSGVNIRTHAFRFELGLTKKVTFQSLVFIQNALKNSGQFPNFFVPLNAFTPRQYRFQEQLVFSF
jgi:Putative porin